MRRIGERISIKAGPERSTVVISSKISSGKEALLAAWIVCWLLCLGYFLYELVQPHEDRESVVLFVLVVFMAYYAFRTIKTYFWRKMGMEYLRIDEDGLAYKRAIKSYGKSRVYFLEHIKNVSVVTKEDGSFAKILENSFWVMGGERISFDYMKRSVRLGMQLNHEDSLKLGKWLQEEVKKQLKNKTI